MTFESVLRVLLVFAAAMALAACAPSQPPDEIREPRVMQDPHELPYGIPVRGRPGYVRSPYRPEAAAVNVKGKKPGQRVRDPVAHKFYLVP